MGAGEAGSGLKPLASLWGDQEGEQLQTLNKQEQMGETQRNSF